MRKHTTRKSDEELQNVPSSSVHPFNADDSNSILEYIGSIIPSVSNLPENYATLQHLGLSDEKIADVIRGNSAYVYGERSKVAMIIEDEAARDVLDSLSCATQMRVVILPEGAVARYASEDSDTYSVDIQDSFIVSKEGTIVETWSAADGKGVVFMKEPGMVQVLYEPDLMAGVKSRFTLFFHSSQYQTSEILNRRVVE